ncbi:cobalt-precorrin-6A reductase [Microvirga terrae]|uniref:Cobalt-precorrin-6A reductase n=1 Tax=Microvirga terrae TaxID=2740529 RepID=A0ABY5RL87_9HYPH|nr:MULTISPECIES: cobalt-precorrin-6A reductase [Microvirga]MBQ0823812.1 cobalt-precorrin-6A reductase [Microvirga sp. HBU67558]UVF17970.1 cobalt-precorrin-6A reductase [Microvirga terrae]
MRILILGGTTEASALAARLAGRSKFSPLLSMAGRTSDPRPMPVPTRIGGFGGAAGLARFLQDEGIEAVVDATHPFAAVISRNAAEACRQTHVPLLALRRPAWTRQEGDHWIEVSSMEAAVNALGQAPRRVFLTVGRLELAPFAVAPQHTYLVRTIEPIGNALMAPNVAAIQDRAPFDEAAERLLMERERVDVVVTKNSGGAATYPKILAAQSLRLPVIVVTRPQKPLDTEEVATADAALDWLERVHGRIP